jgi:DNA-binding response OmpR family regulator
MRSVLIIEDDPAMELALRSSFEKAGFAVDSASDGYVAIECIRENTYDAILLDFVLRHGLNGFGVLNYLEMEQPELVERVFVMTGMSVQTVMRAAPDLMPRFFRKPFDHRTLVAAVLAFVDPAPAAAATGGKTVLVVEDDVASARGMCDFVEATGWSARSVDNGRSAIEELVGGDVHAIVLDLVMPGIDGFEVIEYIRDVMPDFLSRTVVVTGVPEHYRERLAPGNPCAVLLKPVQVDDLRAALKRCLA